MKKAQGRKVQKAASKTSKKVTNGTKKLAKAAATTARKVKSKKTKSALSTAKKKINALKSQSSKTLKRAKNKIVHTEEEIFNYVKENPVKSISTVALVGLIAGFVSRMRK